MTITVQAIPALSNGMTPFLGNAPILHRTAPASAAFAPGEIVIPPSSVAFLTPNIYFSSQNTYDAVGLVRVAQVFTGLDHIHGMQFEKAENGGTRI